MLRNKFTHRRLDSIEDVEDFYAAIKRQHITKMLSAERPYTYWTIELYDQANGIRGGGGLGVLAADTRRVAEQLQVPFVLVTPFYPSEAEQKIRGAGQLGGNERPRAQGQPGAASDGRQTSRTEVYDEHHAVDYHDFGFNFVDKVNIRCNDQFTQLDVIEKQLGSTRIVAITEPGFGELYQGESGSDHRLYQEVALGFGGYQALKLLGLRPAIMQLNEVATFFAALARLDELTTSGMDFYEAVVYTRKHTLYTNHTLVQAAEAEFGLEQFERYVFPNLHSQAVAKWLRDKFEHGRLKLSTVTIEIAELRSGVSKLHARVAEYYDLAGNKVKFKAITNGIDMHKWVMPENLRFLQEQGILDKYCLPTPDYQDKIERRVTAAEIWRLKNLGRAELNKVLANRPDHLGRICRFENDETVFVFKRRFVDYKRPWLPFTNAQQLREILVEHDAHYILTGRIHTGDGRMQSRLAEILDKVDADPLLRERVHYLPNYDEALAYGLSAGANVAVNLPIVGLEACGTSWMKDVANFGLLVSTHDGGVADAMPSAYLNVAGESGTPDEIMSMYDRLDEAASAWENDYDLEYWVRHQLIHYLPVISGTRMLKDYLEYLF